MRASAVIASLCCSACFSKPPAPAAGPADAVGDAAADGQGACASYTAWNPPVPLAVNTADHEWGPWLSPDKLELWFSRATQDLMTSHVYRVTRPTTANPFDTTLTAVSLGPGGAVPDEDGRVYLSDDLDTIYWTHQQSYEQIEVASRSSPTGSFGVEGDLGIDQKDTLDVYDATLTTDQLTMVFAQGLHTAQVDYLRVATRRVVTDGFTSSTQLTGAFATGSDPRRPSLSGDGHELFWSDAATVGGPHRLFVATRLGPDPTTYTPGEQVAGQPTLGAVDNIDPMLTRDGKTLVFASDKQDGNGYDLYEMDRDCQP